MAHPEANGQLTAFRALTQTQPRPMLREKSFQSEGSRSSVMNVDNSTMISDRFGAPIELDVPKSGPTYAACSSSSVIGQDQVSFKKPLPPPQRMQDEPEDLSLPADERASRLSFWSFVEQKKQIGEIVLACTSCLLVFSDPLLYRMHIGMHSWSRSFQCSACGTVCQDRVAFQRHLIGAPHL